MSQNRNSLCRIVSTPRLIDQEIIVSDDETTQTVLEPPAFAVSDMRSMPSRRVPCKARGMGDDHSANAFFLIPENAPHGTLVVCSHRACNESGRRFRYCAVCELPCAKRNFSRRHSHGKTSQQCQEYYAVLDAQQQSGAEARKQLHHPENLGNASNPKFDQCSQIDMSVRIASSSNSGDTPDSPGLNAVEANWLSILAQRPNIENTDAMSGWMNKVIQLSESVHVQPTHGEQVTMLLKTKMENPASRIQSIDVNEVPLSQSFARTPHSRDNTITVENGKKRSRDDLEEFATSLPHHHHTKRRSLTDALMLRGALGDLEKLWDSADMEDIFN